MRQPEAETEIRKHKPYAEAVAPVTKDGLNLRLTTSVNGLGFFEDKADAEAYYQDCLEKSRIDVEMALLMVDNIRARIEGMQRKACTE